MNQSKLTNTSYTIPIGFLIERSFIKSLIVVGVGDPNPSLRYTTYAIKLIQSTRSHYSFSKLCVPVVEGIVKAPRSSFFSTIAFDMIALQLWVTSNLSSLTLVERVEGISLSEIEHFIIHLSLDPHHQSL